MAGSHTCSVFGGTDPPKACNISQLRISMGIERSKPVRIALGKNEERKKK